MVHGVNANEFVKMIETDKDRFYEVAAQVEGCPLRKAFVIDTKDLKGRINKSISKKNNYLMLPKKKHICVYKNYNSPLVNDIIVYWLYEFKP